MKLDSKLYRNAMQVDFWQQVARHFHENKTRKNQAERNILCTLGQTIGYVNNVLSTINSFLPLGRSSSFCTSFFSRLFNLFPSQRNWFGDAIAFYIIGFDSLFWS
mmetsp:Transcript_28853/g.42513  ORF Transcript_28853/g.42513 Transcript_28853/m.42513 type:complete len:105 (+) Transcript_28853:194-508(+)